MEKNNKIKKIGFKELTKSEKTLLTILGFIVLIWACFRFIFEPQYEKITSLEDEKKKYTLLIEEQNSILKSQDKINKEWEVLNGEREKILSKYFPTLDQAQILYLLNDLIDCDAVNILDLSFTRPYTELKADKEVYKMDIDIPLNGTYEGIMDILRALRNSPRRMIVDNLSLDRQASNTLEGSIGIKVYSLEGLAEADKDVVFIDTVEGNNKSTPFAPFEDYRELNDLGESEDIVEKEENIIPGKSNTTEHTEEKREGQILYDFENRMYEFIPSSPLVQGGVLPSSINKSGKSSLRFEYNILALEEENRAYIDLHSNNIVLKVPPSSLGIWVYSYGYSPGILGMRLKGQAGEEIDISMVEGINWTGWSYIEIELPRDLKLYPLKVDKLFYELSYGREDIGVLLFDKLEVYYNDTGDSLGNKNQFYVVKEGESISDISMKVYGTTAYTNEIMKLNGIKSNDRLPPGKVLVLKSR